MGPCPPLPHRLAHPSRLGPAGGPEPPARWIASGSSPAGSTGPRLNDPRLFSDVRDRSGGACSCGVAGWAQVDCRSGAARPAGRQDTWRACHLPPQQCSGCRIRRAPLRWFWAMTGMRWPRSPNLPGASLRDPGGEPRRRGRLAITSSRRMDPEPSTQPAPRPGSAEATSGGVRLRPAAVRPDRRAPSRSPDDAVTSCRPRSSAALIAVRSRPRRRPERRRQVGRR